METIILASSNPGKIKEIQAIFNDYKVISLKEAEKMFNKKLIVTEEQDTSKENALEKVRGLYDQIGAGYICIADDSGLFIDCLNGFPGVHTARWMDADDHTKNLALLEKVNATGDPSRTCHYATAIALKSDDSEETFESTLDGTISAACRGDNGFGFDEIFQLSDGRTLAELSMDEKNEFSPRRMSLEKLREFFK